MENFLKQNWFKIIIAVAILIVSVCVGYYFISLPKQQEQAKNNLLNQQGCSDAAQKYFKDNGYQDMVASYKNHYNTKLNKCFILVNYTNKDILDGKLHTSWVLSDIFGNQEYASYDISLTESPSCIIDEQNTSISVLPGMNGKTCNSKEEFDNYVQPYLSN